MKTAPLVGLLVLVMTLACAAPPDSRSQVQPHRATVSGGELHLDGQPWWPTGLNAYQLATDWSINRGCGAMVDLDEYFGSLPDGAVTRFNVFQQLAVNKFTGELDFAPIDAVFAAAELHEQMVIPVLVGQDGACEDEQYKDRDWYLGGWEQPTAMPLSYRDWVTTAVERWSGSPVIAAWEPIGEPETAVCGTADCHWLYRTCPADSAEVLREWTDEVGQLIRQRDPGRLITAGLLGGDQCGLVADGYRLIAESPYVDVLQYHDYDNAGFLPLRLAQTDKPLVVTELGIAAGSCLSLEDRAVLIGERIDDYEAMGAAGAMLWAFVPDPRPTECTFDIGPEDPVRALPRMARNQAY
ncbi:beta-mannosidase [Dietzia natronolimnaea]|uniref:beta-mannosidase n=1 Tax=Dietzia natronolimnaea TaxID=161920 RepID=UPI0015F9B271|nr:beta-mannosidase [Dietzia natronolimnaea]MBB1038549.1 beta-mannosidase [Dietzia natronolimnaea]